MKRVLPPLIAGLIFLTALLPSTASGAPLMPASSSPASVVTHIVEQGDTLYSIARRYGTTVDALKAINGLTNDVIWIGQTLQIGSSSLPSFQDTYYTVVSGDTLYSIARHYGTTVDILMRANHLTSTYIFVGQRLLVTSSTAPPQGNVAYTVVRGDTLYSIAQRHGTKVDAIMAVNGLSSARIYIGQRLLLPSSRTPPVPSTTPLPTITPAPTLTGTPTPTTTPISTNVIIQSINYDGTVPDTESDEYAVIANTGTTSVNIGDWRLRAGDRGQDFDFPEFELVPGQMCRVYTDEVHPESCGFSFDWNAPIWNNEEGDCGYLYNDNDALISTYCYPGEE